MNDKIYVWDKFVRIFHWSLVILFITSYVTGEEETIIHIYSGYAIVGLVVARIIWGFVGKKHARFSDFVPTPSKVITYVKSIKAGNPTTYLGHNPLGALMVITMLITLLVITLSGMKLYAVEEGKGPFAQDINVTLVQTAIADDDDGEKVAGRYSEEDEELWEEVHEIAVNFMLLLILIHIGGVVFSSRIHNQRLVKSMITGYKEKH